MTALVVGGARSGKSALAESLCGRWGGPLLYIATLRPGGDAENLRRIAAHRQRRAQLGFATLERYDSLAQLRLPRRYGTVLLECLGNLAANEIFEKGLAPADFAGVALAGAVHMERQADNLVVVSNQIFSGAEDCGPGTRAYMDALAAANRALAGRADVVAEAVCGIPVWHKGERWAT